MPGIKRGDLLTYDPSIDDLDSLSEPLNEVEAIALEDEDTDGGYHRTILIYTETGVRARIPVAWVMGYAYGAAYDLTDVLQDKWDELHPEGDDLY